MLFADKMNLPEFLKNCKENIESYVFFKIYKSDLFRELDAYDEELLESINKTKEEIELVLKEMFHKKMHPAEVIQNSNMPEQIANSNDLISEYSDEVKRLANVVFFGDWKKLDLLYYLNDNFDPGARNFTELTKYNQIYYFLNQLYKDSGGTIPKEQYKSLIKKSVRI